MIPTDDLSIKIGIQRHDSQRLDCSTIAGYPVPNFGLFGVNEMSLGFNSGNGKSWVGFKP